MFGFFKRRYQYVSLEERQAALNVTLNNTRAEMQGLIDEHQSVLSVTEAGTKALIDAFGERLVEIQALKAAAPTKL